MTKTATMTIKRCKILAWKQQMQLSVDTTFQA